jgi:hypothetical protein
METTLSQLESWASESNLLMNGDKTKQTKTKQNKTKQNKTKQNKTKQNKTKQMLLTIPRYIILENLFLHFPWEGR